VLGAYLSDFEAQSSIDFEAQSKIALQYKV
jgi:hypothetical protein